MMRKFLQVFLFTLLITPLALRAQFIQDFHIVNVNSNNGLPQNSVIDIALNKEGYLWLSTESGLVRYDGNRSRIFNSGNHTGIVNDHFKWITKTDQGELLVSDQKGNLFLIENNQLKPFHDGRRTPYINLFGGINNVSLLDNVYIPNLMDTAKSKWFREFTVSVPINENEFLVLAKKRIDRFKGNYKTATIFPDGFLFKYLFRIGTDVYVISNQDKFYRLDLASHRFIESGVDIMKGNATLPAGLKTNIFWKHGASHTFLKVKNKLYSLRRKPHSEEVISELFFENLPENCIISSIVYSKQKDMLFLGTDTRGLFIIRRNTLKNLIADKTEEGTNNAYYALAPLNDSVILSTYGRMFSQNRFLGKSKEITRFNIECLLTDKRGNIWFGVSSVLYRFNPHTKTKTLIGKLPAEIFAFYEEDDSIWVGTKKSLSYVKNDKLTHIGLYKEGQMLAKPESMLRGADGQLWIGTCQGIYAYDTKSIRNSLKLLYPEVCARHLFRYKDLYLIATYGNGYYAYHEHRFCKLPLDPSGRMSIVHSFLSDKNELLWISTNSGLFRTSVSAIKHYLTDTTSSVYYTFFGDNSGANNIEFNGGCNPSSLSFGDSLLCFPSIDGIMVLNPYKPLPLLPAEHIFIDQVKTGNRISDSADNIEMESGMEHVVFYFSTPYWYHRSNIQMDYKLQGFQSNWITLDPGMGTISFSSLPSGNYKLRIRKRFGYGVQDYVYKEVSFRINKAFYETWFFVLFIIMLISASVWGLVVFLTRRLEERNLLLESKVKERTYELQTLNNELHISVIKLSKSEQDLQQSVGVKNKLISIISHDIITPLKFMSMISRNAFKDGRKVDQKNAEDILKDIGSASEKLYDNAQNILNWIRYQNKLITVNKTNIAINPLVDELAELMSEMAENKGNKFVNDTSLDDVITTDRNILSVILQNILSNANKYCANSTIRISSSVAGNKYKIAVKDNGPGMNEKVLERIISIQKKIIPDSNLQTGEGNSLGFIIITDLLELLGGHLEIISEEGNGTEVIIFI